MRISWIAAMIVVCGSFSVRDIDSSSIFSIKDIGNGI
jgi:hypothetical protein